MRSYYKVYLKLEQGTFPGYRYYGEIGEVPGQAPDAVYAFKKLKKDDFISALNQIAFLYITVWGGPDSVPPGTEFSEPALNFLSSFFPFIPYDQHPEN
jgi:hypothetical protein